MLSPEFWELCLNLVYALYLNLILPESDLCKLKWVKHRLFNHLVLILLLASHISILYQIVWEQLTAKLNLAVLPYGNDWFYKFMKVYQNYCCKKDYALLTQIVLFYWIFIQSVRENTKAGANSYNKPTSWNY